MRDCKAELEEDIYHLKDEIDWVKQKLIQNMWGTEELGKEERALQARLDDLEIDLADAEMNLKEFSNAPKN